MLVVALLLFLLPFIFGIVFNIISETRTSNFKDVSNFLNVFRIYLPVIVIFASVPTSLIYAAIKTSK